jgi:hypothetical protein
MRIGGGDEEENAHAGCDDNGVWGWPTGENICTLEMVDSSFTNSTNFAIDGRPRTSRAVGDAAL